MLISDPHHDPERGIYDREVVDYCLEMFNCPPAEKTIAIRKCKFLTKFKLSSSILCRALTEKAELELSSCRPMSAVNG